MKFIDEVEIVVESGKGGDGCASFLRERYNPFGGPDGGDGGRGGDVIFTATNRQNTLSSLRSRPLWKARSGVPGGTRNCTGAKGESIEIQVPVGTRIFDVETGEQVADLVESEQKVVLLQGGRGGLGNVHFKTSTNRAPRKYTEGKPGERKRLRLELMVMADIGLLGYPNAGKSTFISKVSGAKPKIANYPFTTLAPKLGVVDMGMEGAYTVADIPGLIEGAAEGAGLGHQFLRHVRRTKTLLHLVSLGPDEKENPVERYLNIRQELEKFDQELSEKREVIALSKSDLVDDEEVEIVIELLREHVGEKPIFIFSSFGEQGLDELRNHLWQIILGDI